MTRVASGSVPKDVGTFTSNRNQRPVLHDLGVDLRCVTVGRREAMLVEDDYSDDGGVLLVPGVRSVKRQARAFVEWCEAEGIVMVLGINSIAIVSALPHLPEHIRVVARCANGFDHGYRITLSGRGRLARIVALTPLLRDTLIRRDGLERDEAHARARRRLLDRLGVRGIVLVPLDERFDVARRQQPYRVTELLDRAPPIVRRSAGLHRQHAPRLHVEKRQQLLRTTFRRNVTAPSAPAPWA